MISDLEQLYAAHIEWLGLRKGLKGQPKRFFWRWLFEQGKEIVKRASIDPVLLQKQCREIQRGSRRSPSVGISHATLQRYAEDLARTYLAMPVDSRPSFAEWLLQIKQACLTEEALRRRLGVS